MAGDASRQNGMLGGRPPGAKSFSTIEREKIFNEIRGRTLDTAHILYNAQLTLARGCNFLFKIEKEKVVGPKGGIKWIPKKPEIVTSLYEIQAYLEDLLEESDHDNENEPGATYYYMTTEKPNGQAIDSMLDRTFGSAVKSIEMSGKDGVPLTSSNDAVIADLAQKINEIHERGSIGGNGVVAYTLDIKTPDKERVGDTN